MAPIYDTDIAESRWADDEWRNFELWEQIEARHRRNRRIWIAGAVALFLMISSVPVIQNRKPYWDARAATGKLGSELNWMKRMSSQDGKTYRARIVPGESIVLEIERGEDCISGGFEAVSKLDLGVSSERFRVLEKADAGILGVPHLAREFCYSPLLASRHVVMALAPVKDLTPQVGEPVRLDRVSVLEIEGESAEISFN